jgi:hypothetical protein
MTRSADLAHCDRTREVFAIRRFKLRCLRLLFRLRDKATDKVFGSKAKAEARKAGKDGRAAKPGRNAA